jgi:hypothetical protein
MVETRWPELEVTQEHLQNIVSQGYMTTMEFATCLVPVDPVSPTPVKDYIVVCAALYEGDLVCYLIDSSSPCSGPMAWSCIT